MLYPRIFGMPAFGSFPAFDELDRMRRRMDRLMEALSSRPSEALAAGVFPALNLSEDENNFFIRAELPGVESKDLEVQATARNLTISGERKLAIENKSARYHRREREGGRFSRALALPKEIDTERVEAKLQNGILTLRVPKSEAAKPRRITIEK